MAAISDWPRLFHDANLSSGTAEDHVFKALNREANEDTGGDD